jgi:hypothetical protein
MEIGLVSHGDRQAHQAEGSGIRVQIGHVTDDLDPRLRSVAQRHVVAAQHAIPAVEVAANVA